MARLGIHEPGTGFVGSLAGNGASKAFEQKFV
jgi:hypothetical protein